jgi:hypothetical protein
VTRDLPIPVATIEHGPLRLAARVRGG